ncbi:hypothetical protein LC653_27405 [Nostoc sp. CHAB 5784]|uniref:hypothetical protein n=1 Tax=Nostoc mirabile TaxID=2907820 RepID=UPI001E4051FC|nr:hypothetical protein [Nostoc mirabile]MCC5667507.1 hypothetical protein [Nostoc mirabile CHAB5784]
MQTLFKIQQQVLETIAVIPAVSIRVSNPTFSATLATPSHKTADFSRLTNDNAIA